MFAKIVFVLFTLLFIGLICLIIWFIGHNIIGIVKIYRQKHIDKKGGVVDNAKVNQESCNKRK